MNPESLYIIGIGFYLFHGLKSTFNEFKNFITEYDGQLFDKIEEYFGANNLLLVSD